MQAQNEAPPDMQCKDKFLLQSVVANAGIADKDITPEMFSKQPVRGRVVEECKLRVVYLPPPQPPLPILEEPNEVASPKVSVNSRNLNGSEVTRQSMKSDSEARSLIIKLTDERNVAIQQSKKLRKEIELFTHRVNKSQGDGVSIIVVIAICLIGLILGYLMKK